MGMERLSIEEREYINRSIESGKKALDVLIQSLNNDIDGYNGPNQEAVDRAQHTLDNILKKSAEFPHARYYVFVELEKTGILSIFITKKLYDKLKAGPPKTLAYIGGNKKFHTALHIKGGMMSSGT